MHDEVLTPDQVEEEFGVPKSTQASYRSRGTWPFFLVAPATPRYRRSELEATFERITAQRRARKRARSGGAEAGR